MNIPEEPVRAEEYSKLPENRQADLSDALLSVARSYYLHRDELVYSIKSNTFLSGRELYDAGHGGRGRIDCSTYIHLVLQGIPYEKSPYATGTAASFYDYGCPWAFRPFLEGFKEKKPARRAFEIGRYFWDRGLCRTGRDWQPGDILFFQVRRERVDFYLAFLIFKAICHMGMVAEDGLYMYESHGNQTENTRDNYSRPGVQRSLITDREPPIFFVRPADFLNLRQSEEPG